MGASSAVARLGARLLGVAQRDGAVVPRPIGRCDVRIGANYTPQVRLVGVTNVDGITRPKTLIGKGPEKYKRVQVGNLVYNPMRINVGSIGLVRDLLLRRSFLFAHRFTFSPNSTNRLVRWCDHGTHRVISYLTLWLILSMDTRNSLA